MDQFKTIEITGKTFFEKGNCYGSNARHLIALCINSYKEHFAKNSELSWEQLRTYAMSFLPKINQEMPEILEEARGIANGAQVPFEDIMVINCRYEITRQPESNECTTAAILPTAGGGKTYLVKNWDYRAGIMDHIVILHIKEKDGPSILGLSEAGQMIREGFNSHGVGLCNNGLTSVYDHSGSGIPVTFLRRKVLGCSSFESAKELLISAQRSVSNNMLLVSADGYAVDIEANPLGCDTIECTDGILTHANHFVRTPHLNATEKSPRDERLYQLLHKNHSHIDVPYIKQCVADHANIPKSICSHPSDLSIPLENRGMTVAALIIDFSDQCFHVCAGPPCAGKFQSIPLTPN